MLLTAAGVVYWQLYRKPPQHNPLPSASVQTSEPFFFSLKPPSRALTAHAVSWSGGVKKNTRTDPTMLPVQEGPALTLIEGEALQTDASGSAVVSFNQHLRLTISPNSEVTLSNTQPAGFLLRQGKGTVTYEQLQDRHSSSIRVLNTLVVLPSGSATLSVDSANHTVEITDSTKPLQFAFIDQDNETQVFTLAPSQTAIIDDSSRLVDIKDP